VGRQEEKALVFFSRLTMPASAAAAVSISAAVLLAAVRSGDARALSAELSKRAPFSYAQAEEAKAIDR